MNNGNVIVTSWLKQAVALLEENAARLNDLDKQIGDGDHGTNMLRGFAAALATIAADESAAENIKHIGMALVSNVGGASGPLFGTFFLRAGTIWQADLTTVGLSRAFRSGLDGVMARGKAERGDATMVDALGPAVDSLEASARQGLPLGEAMKLATSAADEGASSTSPMIARRGRASQFGEASVGHLDPGAVSAALLLGIRVAQGSDGGQIPSSTPLV